FALIHVIVTLVCYAFSCVVSFFYCYVHLRDLHSFPTRRSSDLQSGEPRPARYTTAGNRFSAVCRVPPRSARPSPVERPWESCRADRKSTRLNSSHVKISYAVFCLKKKNTIKSDNK